MQVLQSGSGEITVYRRPTATDSAHHYLPCINCLAWIHSANFSMHAKTCPAGKTIDHNHLRNSKMLISPFITFESDDTDIEDLLFKMKETHKNPGLKKICMEDKLIKEFCRGLLHRLGTEEEQRRKDKDNIRTKLRAVARLLSSLNEKTGENGDLSSYTTPNHFMLVVNTVREMGKESPQLALTLGHYVKQIIELKHSLGLRTSDTKMQSDAAAFSVLFSAHWNSYVAAVTLRRMKLRTLNKTIELPKTEDMVKLKEYLDLKIENSLQQNQISAIDWTDTSQAIMVRILLFNKRRVSEVGEMKVSDIAEAKTAACSDNDELVSQMDIAEKALANRMIAIEVRGKSTRGLRKVFVVLTNTMFKACQNLVQMRMYVGVPPSNPYLFVKPSGSVLDGCQAMRDVTQRCPGLERPELIRTRLLRKYLATTIQIMDMTGDELKMVADHMGHSVAVHTDVYRMQSSLLERTKVARALVALENGKLGKFAGRNLSSCTLEELPIPVADDDGDAVAGYGDAVADICGDAVADICGDDGDVDNCDNGGDGHEQNNEDLREIGNIRPKRAHTMTSQENEHVFVKKRNPPRKKWDENEEACLYAEFKDNISRKSNPSNSDIKRAQAIHPCLNDRTIAVIKSKVNNIILGKCKLAKFERS